MSIPDDQPSQGLREKSQDGPEQADELRQVLRALHGPPSSQRGLSHLGFAPLLQRIASYWWIELLVGVFWVAISLVVLKFNHGSITTVGILIGLMFLVFAAEEFVLAYLDRGTRWLWAIFGVLLTAGGILALIHPRRTFVGFADILGFVFLVVGVMWMVQAFMERVVNGLWWMTLIAGILMTALAFWVSDKLFIERAYTLLIFAGVWAMTSGVIAVIRAFQIREFGQRLKRPFG
jgi:uncharacterized membrane protein HdeD (DUF308 family)